MNNPSTPSTPPGKIDLPSLGSRITDLRVRRRWSQRQLAQLTGLRPERVSRLEKAVVDPGLQEIATLAAVFETGLEVLIHGGGDEELARVAAQRGLTPAQADLALRALGVGLAVLRQEGRGPQ